ILTSLINVNVTGNTVSNIDSGFTVLDSVLHDGANHIGCFLAHKIKTNQTAENPTWTVVSNDSLASRIASFKVAIGGGSFGDSGVDNFLGTIRYLVPGGIVDTNSGG